MREIKFRAWSPENKELIYFDNKKAAKDRYIAGHLMMLMANEHYVGKDLLMQYTGLKDDNGVEIYEGDILRAGEDNFIIKAQWSDKGFWQCQYYYKGEKNKTDGLVYAIKSRAKALDCKCLVIGNIYENHDLLESNNE